MQPPPHIERADSIEFRQHPTTQRALARRLLARPHSPQSERYPSSKTLPGWRRDARFVFEQRSFDEKYAKIGYEDVGGAGEEDPRSRL